MAVLVLIGIGGLMVMAAAGDRGANDSTGAPPAGRPATSVAPTGDGAVGATPTGGSVPGDELTGFGARIETWRRSHVAEGNPYVPGTSYDGNHFGEVMELDGRILGFDINYARRGVPLAVARAHARQQLPGDTAVVWSETLDDCVVQQMRSETLSRVLYPRWLPSPGDVQVRYDFDDVEPSLETSRIVSINITGYVEERGLASC